MILLYSLLHSFVVLSSITTSAQAWAITGTNPRSMTMVFHEQSLLSSRGRVLFLSAEEHDGEQRQLATDLRRLFDKDEMAYTVMVREDKKGPDGKLTPDQLLAAIQKDDMFGEEFEEYAGKYGVKILDIGKFADDFESCTPLPEELQLTIQGKGNYLVHVSFTDDIFATMRIVVD